MASNIIVSGVDLDTYYAPHVTSNASFNTGYQVTATDIRTRYDVLSSPATVNLGARIPAIGITTSATGWSPNTDLSSIFCGNVGQYSLTVPSNATKSTTGWVSPKTWTHTVTITFANAAALTSYFFYGGRIQVSPSHTAGTAADNALSTMFSNMGTLVIYDQGHYVTGGGTILNGTVGGSNLGNTLTNFYQTNDGTPYTASSYLVRAQANAAAGSATVITVTTVLTIVTAGVISDTYTGTYTSTIQQRNHPTQTVPTFASTLV